MHEYYVKTTKYNDYNAPLMAKVITASEFSEALKKAIYEACINLAGSTEGVTVHVQGLNDKRHEHAEMRFHLEGHGSI